jgi:hypothetical protein
VRADEATLLSYQYLDALRLRDWKVKVIERFTAPQLASLDGYCEAPDKTIWLVRSALSTELIQHECAHCLQPSEQYRDEAKAHGSDFEKALEQVKGLKV